MDGNSRGEIWEIIGNIHRHQRSRFPLRHHDNYLFRIIIEYSYISFNHPVVDEMNEMNAHHPES